MDTDTTVEVPPGHWRREATHCPQPLSPLFGAALPALTECFRRLFAELGVPSETLEWREIGGWVYTRMVPLGDGTDPAGAAGPEARAARAEASADAIRTDRFGRYLDEWPEWRAGFVAGVDRLRAVDLAGLDEAGLAGHLDEVMTFALGAFETHFLLHGINAVTLADLAFTCDELLGWDDVRSMELLRGLSDASTAPADALARLTALARERPAVRDVVMAAGSADFAGGNDGDPADLADRLAAADPDFADAFAAYLDEFGFRAVRYEAMDPSLQETPAFVLGLVARQLGSGAGPDERAARADEQREAARTEARTALAMAGADRARFERALDRAERWYPVREDNAPMTMSEPTALIRRVALEMGRHLAKGGVVDEADDVFFLLPDELVGALLALPAGAAPDLRATVARRVAEREAILARPGPLTYGAPEDGAADRRDLPPEAAFADDALRWLIERSGHWLLTHEQPAGDRITGVAGSAGRYTGPARILRGEADFGKLQPGDVLVCPITSPTWSVLFPQVGALVTDAGGLLSHSAIIAREFRLPAVVATGNATALLRDGQLVTVDGTDGSVSVVR